jgi:hypothetical protein
LRSCASRRLVGSPAYLHLLSDLDQADLDHGLLDGIAHARTRPPALDATCCA